MNAWEHATFVFISTNQRHEPGGVEERWLAVMAELVRLGATVQFLCLMGSPVEARARELGINVAPYILDKWNVVRSRSRLRKYLRRYVPVCAHSTGVEADLLLRWAARKVPGTRIVVTLPADERQATRRGRPMDSLMRRWDLAGIVKQDVVFAETDDLLLELLSAGAKAERIMLDPPAHTPEALRSCVAHHVGVYREFLKER